ncbi:DUF1514 family protein [Staphylococcus haemolyticus]|nr:DUF1514 family protein [Staphylococcus haemolyticus]QXA66061.1 DUF1514 family protein [Staphylococcus haemolyticus]GEQ07192.1 hypothetical protein SHA04_00690 [Staphylococcus haemolyticus]SUM39501.1 Uncharacterised protein [Staphylococcus haemolyticus]
MWPILTILLALLYLISIMVQHEQKKEIETLETINHMLRNALHEKL